ncbi:MAG: hypothetical protein LBQ36_04300 [Synergistaceae bacterium]|jgi:hypothetical protein|nr:hypothetical protein [Synergistaceae bacterium]
MRTIEFDSLVDGDIIRIPEQFRDISGGVVKVIVMSSDEPAPKQRSFGPEDFNELKIPTKGWKFDREKANERR